MVCDDKVHWCEGQNSMLIQYNSESWSSPSSNIYICKCSICVAFTWIAFVFWIWYYNMNIIDTYCTSLSLSLSIYWRDRQARENSFYIVDAIFEYLCIIPIFYFILGERYILIVLTSSNIYGKMCNFCLQSESKFLFYT